MSIATGGIVTEYTNNVKFYKVHKFESTGQLVVNETVSIDYLIVAGGGGGGGDGGGGGGAGGLIQGTTILSPGTYPIVVGGGGAGGVHTSSSSSRPLPVRGSNSAFLDFIAVGGGAGGSGQSNLGTLGYPTSGGSGGGGGGEGAWEGNTGAVGTANQGNSGGNGFASSSGGGGGGGGAGGSGISSTSTRGGAGGIGTQSDITGENLFYAGGGGGGNQNNVTIASAGGLGGGGAGGAGDVTYPGKIVGEGQDGTAGTGGGGGGHTYTTGNETVFAGTGGSGVVIIRYETIPPVSGGTILDVTINDVVYRTHTFTSSGTLSLTQETNINFLIVGGGGGGTINNFPGSGGPGGAVNSYSNRNLVIGNYAVVVGAGGAPYTGLGFGSGQSGGSSTITGTGINLVSNGGETYGVFQTRTVLFNGTTYTGNNAAGGSGSGQNGQVLNGGRGSSTGFSITQAIADAGATTYAELDQGVYYYGGGGGSGNNGLGGLGHGGNGAGSPTGVQAGSPNSGGGGGGGTNAGNTAAAGGSGLIIAYYPYQEEDQELTFVQAQGGDIISSTIINGKNYKTHVFESSGTFTVSEGGLVDIMVLGGGGGGGDNGGGGGGAGGVRTDTVSLLEGTYVVTVGSGGAATESNVVGGTTGNSSALQPSTLMKAHSFVFDGSGDAINAGVSADYAPGTGAFCVEAWIFVNRLKNFGCIMTTRPNNSGYADAWHCGFDQNGAGSLYSNNDQIIFPQGTIKTGIWQHYVCCRNSSSQAAIFVDGFRVSFGTVTNNFTRQQLGIGDFPVTQAESIDGYISNARFVKGDSVYDPTLLSLSIPTEPLSLYTANLSTTAILTAQDLRFVDNSGPSLLLSTANSAFFDGSGDYLTVFSNSSLAVGSENFTFECWVYTGAPPGGGVTNDKLLFGGFSFTPSFVIFLTNGGNFPALWNGTVQQTSSVAVPTNQWTHVAVVRNNGSLTFYVNGVSGGSNSNSTNWATPSTAFIGRSDLDTTRNFSGYISNLRLVKGSAVYTTNFTPPTQPLSRISGTSVLTLQNTTFIDNSSNNLTITKFGDVSITTFNPFGNVAKTLTPINNVTTSHFNPFYNYVGPGGGGGASRDGGGRGKSGGSGGGGGGGVAAEEAAAGLGISLLGFNGGVGAVATTSSTGAGGGGAASPGTNGASQIAGNGGSGFYTNITGAGRFYAGGGGGGITLNGNSGGIGGRGGGGTRNTINPLPDDNIEATFEYVADDDQIFTVPEGVKTVSVKIWGAGGGSSRNAGSGGGGGFASGNIRVNPGDQLLLKVGRGGNGSGNSTNETQLLLDSEDKLIGGSGGWTGGGAGGSDDEKAGGAGGGGFSAIFKGLDPLLIAGGGGGGGSGAGDGSFPPTAGDGGAGGGSAGGLGNQGDGELNLPTSSIASVGGDYYDATSVGPITSIDSLVSVQGYDSLPNFGYLKYILAANPSNLTVAVSFTKNGNLISQSAFTLNKQAFNYVSSIISILAYGNDDHDTLTMIGDGSGIIARTNTNTISGNWDKFRGSNTLVTNSALNSVTTYPAADLVGGQTATVVAFPLTNSEVWIRLSNQTYRVNNLDIRTFTGAEQTTIGTAAPANSHWTISDGVNQFMIGRIGSTNARIFTVNLTTGELTSEAITLTVAPAYSNSTEEDAFGSKLFTVDGFNTWHAAAQFRYSGSAGWKETRNIFNTTGTAAVTAGSLTTQTGMDIFGSVDASGNVWFADWGHDDGGLFGLGNDDRLNIRQTNITYVSLDNFSTPGNASGGGQTSGGISYGSPTVVSGYLQGAGGGSLAGGGGGGGFYGGGQGGQYGGGGGGSGFAAGTLFGVLTSSLLSGSGINPGNAADSIRGSAGEGAPSGDIDFESTTDELGRKGKNGRIVLNYTVVYNGRNGESKSGSGGAGGSGGPTRFTPGNGGGGIVAIAYLQGGYVKPPLANGGNEVYYGTILGKTYKLHKFTSSGSLATLQSGEAEYLIVAGGGGGGEGGGGGGGVISGKLFISQGQTYAVTVGAGGAGSVDGRIAGANGSNSSFFIVEAIGGGFGGTVNTAASIGGSGGGGRRDGGTAGAAGTAGQGFAGGTSPSGAFRGAAGGGGAAEQGRPGAGSGVSTDEIGGRGGNGLPFNVTGNEQISYFGGGGAGAAEGIGSQGLGGLGGGGNGGYGGFYLQTAGQENTGGGGGGRAALNGINSAGRGGSGVVYIYYPSEIKWQGGRGGQGGPYSGGGGGAGGYSTPALIYQGTDPTDDLETDGVSGLAGKFFNGSWRSILPSGDVGTIPLTADNNSSNITGTTGLPSADHRYGVNSWPFITYSTLGDNYGFIAIGYFKPPVSGTYTFFTQSDDHSLVWIRDIASESTGRTTANAVVNNTGTVSTKRSGNIYLTQGIWYPIRIVHEEGIGGDNLTFSWQGPGIPETTDLTQYFKHPQPIGTWLDFSKSPLVYQQTGNGADGNNVQAGFDHLYAGGGGGGSAQILGGGGGGVGIDGTGTSGLGGALEQGGIGGSGGANGGQGTAGLYGGGGGGITEEILDPLVGNGASGAVKIFWPSEATLLPNVEPAATVINLNETTTNLEISYQVLSETLKTTDFVVADIKSLETDSSTSVIENPFNFGLSIPETYVTVTVTNPQVIASSIVSGSTVITTNEVDQEMMIVNNDKTQIATWNSPTYQVIQRVTPENDPRRITVRLLNYVVGVTGEGPLVPTQIQVWF